MVLLGLAGWLTACRPTDAPSYESLRGQELRAALAAWRAGDLELAASKLRRLPDLRADPGPCEWLARDVGDEQFLRELVTLQERDQLAEGLEAVRARMRSAGLGPRLEQAERTLVALQRVRQYLDAYPFAEASQGQAALAQLPLAANLPTPVYRAWLASQREELTRQQANEARWQRQEAWRVLESSLLKGGSEARLALAQWLLLAPDTASAKLWRSLGSAPAGQAVALVRAATEPATAELGWFFLALYGTPVEQVALPELMRGQWPSTLPGIYAACHMELASGQLGTGLARLAALRQREPAVEIRPLRAALRQALGRLPTSTWPSVPGLLDGLLQLEGGR